MPILHEDKYFLASSIYENVDIRMVSNQNGTIFKLSFISVTIARQECLQCPLVVEEYSTSLLHSSYNSTTGVFTVPSGGGGVFYFSASFLISPSVFARFDIRHNDDVICSGHGDSPGGQYATATCSAVISVSGGI